MCVAQCFKALQHKIAAQITHCALSVNTDNFTENLPQMIAIACTKQDDVFQLRQLLLTEPLTASREKRTKTEVTSDM
jgi:hypothetical protein